MGVWQSNLNPCHFHGYGSIRHRSIDLGFCYTYLLEFYGNTNLTYSYRLYAHNYPIHAHQILAQFLYTFGL